LAGWQDDLSARRRLLDALPSHGLKASTAFAYWAAVDPDGLRELLPVSYSLESSVSAGCVTGAQMHRGRSSPETVANWRMSFANDALSRSGALFDVVSSWVTSGRDGLDSWIAHLPAPEDRDAAIRSAAIFSNYIDCKTALRWAEHIEDPEKRLQALHIILRPWQRETPLQAAAYVAAAAWPEETKRTLALMCLCPSGAFSPFFRR
jgi:hypothetical protein